MKKTGSNQLKLKRRLELVRVTVRELTPTELSQVDGGNTEPGPSIPTFCWPGYSCRSEEQA